MGKPKQHYIEPLKTVILVVLFLMTMLLLYFFWGISNSFRIADIIQEEPPDIPSYQLVTQPERVVVHLGSGRYTVLEERESRAWERCVEFLQGLDREAFQSLEEITAEQYGMIMEFRSVAYRFNYNLPMDGFLRRYGIQQIPGSDQIGDFSGIGFSSGSPESMFFYSRSKNKYYRIVCRDPHPSMDELLTAEDTEVGASYVRLGAVAGTANQTETVIPHSLAASLDEVPYSAEFKDLSAEEEKQFARTFFGESLDFVRQITESKGTHIYMYGYGEKVLTIGAGGRVEYKNRETPQGSQQSYFDALDTAMQFVASHGGWKTAKGMELIPYVQSVREIENNKRKGYSIVFGMRLGDEPLYLAGSHSLLVEVVHGQVTQYQRDLIEVDEGEFQRQTGGSQREAFYALNMIAQNYPYIASVLSQEGYDFSNLEVDALFDAVSDLIILVKPGYVRPKSEGQGDNVLIPAWIVRAGNVYTYFDLYDASPLGHTNLVGS